MPSVVRGRAAITAAITTAIVLVAACSGDDGGAATLGPGPTRTSSPQDVIDAPESGTADPSNTGPATIVTSPSDRVGCEVKVSGDIDAEFTGKDDENAFSSDHYLSQDEIDSILALTTAVTEPTVPGEESDLTIPPRASGTALVTAWFLLNCQGGDITFGVYSDAMSSPDDVPFDNGTYKVTAPGAADDPTALRAFIVFGADPTPGVWSADDGSEITISRFDSHGAKGTFRVPMTEELPATGTSGRQILVEGSFDVTCKEGSLCEGG